MPPILAPLHLRMYTRTVRPRPAATRRTLLLPLAFPLCLAVVVTILASHSSVLAAQSRTNAVPTFAEAEAVVLVLESGNRPKGADGGFDSTRSGNWNTEQLARFVDAKGVAFEDIGDVKKPRWYSPRRELLLELASRKGASFQLLMYVAYLLARERRNSSVAKPPDLEWVSTADGADLVVSHMLRLKLRRGSPNWTLTKVDLFEVPGE